MTKNTTEKTATTRNLRLVLDCKISGVWVECEIEIGRLGEKESTRERGRERERRR